MHGVKTTAVILTRRVQALDVELAVIDAQIGPLVKAAALDLLNVFGVGIDTAAVLLVTAGDKSQRITSAAKWAVLCGILVASDDDGLKRTTSQRSPVVATARTPPLHGCRFGVGSVPSAVRECFVPLRYDATIHLGLDMVGSALVAVDCIRHFGHPAVMHELDELADAYWAHYRLATSTDRVDRLSAGEFRWAWEVIHDRVRTEPETALEVLTFLADAAPDDAALAYLGAGPVEDLLCCGGSDVVIDRVEGAAVRNGNFRKALRCAWFDEHVEPAVAERLRRFGDPY